MNGSEPGTLPTVEPIRPRTPLAVVIAAASIGALVLASSVVIAVHGSTSPGSSPSSSNPRVEPASATRFGPDTRARIDAVRDRAAIGLLSLREPAGDFTTRPGAGVDPAERREATAMGILGLSVAKRMGSKVPGIAGAIVDARRILFKAPKRGPQQSSDRSLNVSALAAALLSLSIGADAADVPRVETATSTLLAMTEPGPPVQGWPQGVAARAYAEILDTGRTSLLGPDPRAVVPVWRDGADQRVSEAFAQAVQKGPAGVPTEIFAKMSDDPVEWNGELTDLKRWTLRAWLAARVPGGDAWFVKALPALENAVDAQGRVEGERYGYPTARTAQILLILWEGTDLRRPTGP
jgi:hypothetical protein